VTGTRVPAFILHWIADYGVTALFVLLMLGVFGLPVPDETLLTFAGALVRQGHLHLTSTLIAATVGSMCGITLSYTLGRTVGPGVVRRYGRYVHISPAQLTRVERWFESWGKWLLTIGYFIPGVRHFTAIVAGSSGLPRRLFAVYAYSGALIWSASFISLGWFVGDRYEVVLVTAHRHMFLAGAILAVLTAGYVFWWRRRGSRA